MAEFTSDAAKWHKRYNIAATHQEPMFKRFAAWYDVAGTVYPQNRKPAAWRSKMLFPTLGNKAYQLAAKFIGLKPGWAVQATLPVFGSETEQQQRQIIEELRDKERKAQQLLDYDYNSPEMDDTMRAKLLAPMMDAIIVGTGLGKVPWSMKTKTTYERVVDSTGQPDMTKEKKTDKKIGFNDLIPVDIFNVFKSPSGSNLYGSHWFVIVEYKTLAQLKDVNEANGGQFYDASALKSLEYAKSQPDRFAQYKSARNRLMKSEDVMVVDETLDLFPVYECYDLDEHTISLYADASGDAAKENTESWVKLRSSNNIYWHGKYPLVSFYIKRKPHNFWGTGIFETNERLDAGKNDIFNHFMDELNVSLGGGLIREENTIANDYIVEPGFEVTYKGEKPQQWKFPEPNPNQLTTVTTLLDRALEDGTLSAYSAGGTNSATDTTAGTKGGILAIQQSADDILTFGRENFRESVTQVGKFFLSNRQQFMDEAIAIRNDANPTDPPTVIKPADIQGELDLKVTEASMQPLSKDQELQQYQGYVAGLTTMIAASVQQAQLTKYAVPPLYVDFAALARDLAQKFGLANSEDVLLSGEEVQKAIQASQAPMVAPIERFNITPADLFPSEVAQFLQRNGVQADPGRLQGQLPPAEQVMAADAQTTGAKAGADPGAITPDHILKADAQAHQQAIEEHRLALQASKQKFDQRHAIAGLAANAMKPDKPVGVAK